MADKTKIEWTDATWTPIRARRAVPLPDAEPGDLAEAKVGWHCEHASEGCRFCYAESMNKRLGTGLAFKPGHRKDVEIFIDDKLLEQPRRWKRGRTIFVCSMTDLFADFVTDAMIDRVVAEMAWNPQHRFQVLTKRPERMRAYFEALPERQRDLACDSGLDCVALPLPNVWLGTSVEDQRAAAARIPHLLATPAAVRFLSCEPLIGPVDLTALPFPKACECPKDKPTLNALNASVYCAGCCEGPERMDLGTIGWVIAGGESGHGARPMHPDWARALRDQCADEEVPFLFKQWGEWVPSATGDRCVAVESGRNMPNLEPHGHNGYGTVRIQRVGKKVAGRDLDGLKHDGMPA